MTSLTTSRHQLEEAAIALRHTKDHLHHIEVHFGRAPLTPEVLELLRSARTAINAAVRELQLAMRQPL